MYKLELNKDEYELFKKKVKCEMIMRDLKIKDLAEMTNYDEQSIRGFLSNRNSKFIAFAIAQVLEMGD